MSFSSFIKNKLLFESWREHIKEDVVDLDAYKKELTQSKNNTVEFYFTDEQASNLESLVNRFKGTLDGLLVPVEIEKRMVAEGGYTVPPKREEGEVIPLPKAKKSKTPFFAMTPQEFEGSTEEGAYAYVLKVDRVVLDNFKNMISALEDVGSALVDAKKWYRDVNEIVRNSVDGENEHVLLATLIAAFSHSTNFEKNLKEAIFAFKAYQFDMANEQEECLREYINSIKGHQRKSEGGTRDIAKFGKLKLTNFALNILDPDFGAQTDEEGNFINYWNTTIDRWMFRAFYPNLDEAVLVKMAGKSIPYVYITKLLAQEASKFNMAPFELQAVIWISIMNEQQQRVDTLPNVVTEIGDKFLNNLDNLEQSVEIVEEETSRTALIIKKLLHSIENIEVLRNYIHKDSSIEKRRSLHRFESEIEDISGCNPENLALYYVLEKYVGLRKVKTQNMKLIFLQAIDDGWDIASGVDWLKSLIGFESTTQGKIIRERNKSFSSFKETTQHFDSWRKYFKG